MSAYTMPYPGFEQHELSLDNIDYPEILIGLPDPPKKLYMIGNKGALLQPAIAIVGSRKATPYGLLCATRFAKRAAAHNLVVISGGAVGCDQAAHHGALELSTPTIVVLGCGADVMYPSDSGQLFTQVLLSGGLIVSELPWGSPPVGWAFVKRNRIIAGLALATLIIEAGMPSGTFSTADAALSLGRELLVVPGSILSKQSAGCNHLIAQGAWPIIDDKSFDTALRDIYVEPRMKLGFVEDSQVATASLAQTEGDETGFSYEGDELHDDIETSDDQQKAALLQRLRIMPSHPDELVGTYGKDVVEVIRYLSLLEFQGQVIRLLDGRFAASF
ncbi:MAG: DNA-processing protein DprA [Coriobacteriia bacterium]|nr:DNA-processing protein DprA [Coriobacteriia bacterium]